MNSIYVRLYSLFVFSSLIYEYLVNNDSDSFPTSSSSNNKVTENPVEIENVTFSSIQQDNNQVIVMERTSVDSTVINESSPLLQHNQSTNEERPSNSFRYSCLQCCSACSIA